MKTTIWGPYIWLTLHAVPLFCWKEGHSVEFASEWLSMLQQILPCSQCQQHYGWYLETYTPTNIQTPEELSNYICDLHNHVASTLGSPTWTCKQVYEFYGFDPTDPSSSLLRFKSRNWILFLYFAIHSPQINWNTFRKFIVQTGQHIPWSSKKEKTLWKQMISVIPEKRMNAFAWFEEFRPQWIPIWSQEQSENTVWPSVLQNSSYLRRMKWILTVENRNPAPVVGTWETIK